MKLGSVRNIVTLLILLILLFCFSGAPSKHVKCFTCTEIYSVEYAPPEPNIGDMDVSVILYNACNVDLRTKILLTVKIKDTGEVIFNQTAIRRLQAATPDTVYFNSADFTVPIPWAKLKLPTRLYLEVKVYEDRGGFVLADEVSGDIVIGERATTTTQQAGGSKATRTITVTKTMTTTTTKNITIREIETVTQTLIETRTLTTVTFKTVTNTVTTTEQSYGGLAGGSILGLIVGTALASAIFILRSRSRESGVVEELS